MIEESEILLRTLKIEDWEELKLAMRSAYKKSGLDIWSREYIDRLLKGFPDGQICIEVNGKTIAAALGVIVNYDKFSIPHNYKDVTSEEYLDNKCKNGDVYYGIEIFVHPDYRGMRLGRRLYDARKTICENLNLKGILIAGRIPKYHEYSSKYSPREFMNKVKTREIYDPVLTFQFSNDFNLKRILKNYLENDTQSKEFAILLEWTNIYYESKPSVLETTSSVVRLGIIQWQMRRVSGLNELLELVEFFVDGISGYRADFALFPEFFNAPLMAPFNEQATPDAIRSLANFTKPILEKIHQLSVSYNVNIIAGSMPAIEDGNLYNISYLCRRDGSIESQKKLHITPSEVECWGIKGGDSMKVFDTDAGRIAINICYDVEFPELARYCALQGVDIIMVPFLTDTQNGYQRVRRCAQARAIENECFVAIAGCVGNLPKVHNMDIQYAQSAVFSPSDFAFPVDAIVSQATPNTEMTVIADIDLSLLKELNANGSVKNLKDRRKDLYELKWLK